MAKLIDADAFVEMMEEKCDHESAIDEWILAVCKGGINKMLPVDAVEVVMGLWKKTTEEKPNSSKHLIVTDGGLISHYGYYVKPKDKWYKTCECEEEIPEPAFWMDMPEPPAESILDECGC